jgi:hypothetical protein
VRFRQTGQMQLRRGHWRCFDALQDVRVDRVEFSWRARVRLAPLVTVRVRDWYGAESSGLDVKLMTIPLGGARGAETARSEAMRYLAELPWFPHAMLLNDQLSWRQLGRGCVEVSASVPGVAGVRAAVAFDFDAAGDIVRVSAPGRPRQEENRMIERPWSGSFSDYGVIGTVRVPAAAEVVWDLPNGAFPYFRARIVELELADS